ncbi:EF-hand domain-containing protein [Streptomyces sp. NPDC089799]|uniref:EF-hand domain-containing protein n=1 Tax=Streptomyces sp. NPDC089799 TaxID=3155066 RepID=UPI0034328782
MTTPTAPTASTAPAPSTAPATSVLTRKLRHLFVLLDADGDGFLTAGDLPAVANRLAGAFPADPEKARRLRLALERIWEGHLRHMDGGGAGRLDPAAYERGVRAATAATPEAFLSALHEAAAAWLSLCDADGNGAVDFDEYTRMGRVLGIAPEEMEVAFARLDRNGDGYLEPEGVHAAVIEFFTSDDPEAAGNWLYGPL